MSAKIIFPRGHRVGRLTVVSEAGHIGRHPAWKCQCDCGNTKVIRGVHLSISAIKSCGCLVRQGGNTKHRCSGTVEWVAWMNMKNRCYNSNRPDYINYGGRGIRVCRRWHKFENFLADMGKKPDMHFSIDRIDNNGNYTPKNCRWTTRAEQNVNKRSTKLSEETIKHMKIMAEHASYVEVGRKFGITPAHARQTVLGLTWRHLKCHSPQKF